MKHLSSSLVPLSGTMLKSGISVLSEREQLLAILVELDTTSISDPRSYSIQELRLRTKLVSSGKSLWEETLSLARGLLSPTIYTPGQEWKTIPLSTRESLVELLLVLTPSSYLAYQLDEIRWLEQEVSSSLTSLPEPLLSAYGRVKNDTNN